MTEALVEKKNTVFLRCSLEHLRIKHDGVYLLTDVERKAEIIANRIPIMKKRKEVLETLSKNNEIPIGIYENLSSELNKALSKFVSEARNLLGKINAKVDFKEDYIKTLHLARTFLEIEYGMGNVKEEIYRDTLTSVLKEVSNASHRKINLLKIKEKISKLLLKEQESNLITNIKKHNVSMPQSAEEKKPITVRMTEE
jgi:hypothetical protein